jgi:oxygen-dependent protoporphyrinogen oxidase
MRDCVIVGGGISGLATAAFLTEAGRDVTVLEAADSAGGLVRSEVVDGRVHDLAPNGWLDNEPAMQRLLEWAELGDRVQPASDRFGRRWIYARGRMHLVPMSPPALLGTGLLSWNGKVRLMLEPLIPRSRPDVEETLAAFVSRRLGSELNPNLVAPMVAGIFGSSPEQLSVRAAFPRLHALEQEHGSLLLGALRNRAQRPHLQTTEGGVGTLIAALVDKLDGRVQTGVRATAVEHRRDGWHVHTEEGSMTAATVVLTCPAGGQAKLVRGMDSDVCAALDEVPYASMVVALSSWAQGSWDHSPDGFGVLVAAGEDMGGVLGTLFTSNLFPGRAPEGEMLLRTFLGGAIHPSVIDMDDQQVSAWNRASFGRFFGTERAPPLAFRVVRHRSAIPVYTPGHTARVRLLRAAEAKHRGLLFCGNHLDGVGIKDCARSAEATAARVDLCLA